MIVTENKMICYLLCSRDKIKFQFFTPVLQTELLKQHRNLDTFLQNSGTNYPHGNSTGKSKIPRPKALPDKLLVQSKILAEINSG